MSTVPNSLDLILQVKEDAIEKLIRLQHKNKIIKHHFAELFDSFRVEIVINSPSVDLSSNPLNNKELAILNVKIFYWRRPADQIDSLGEGTIANAQIKVTLDLSTGNPGDLGQDTFLLVNWEDTQLDDINVLTGTDEFKDSVRNHLLALIKKYGNIRIKVPQIGTNTQFVRTAVFRFHSMNESTADPTRVLSVGMKVNEISNPQKAGLECGFVKEDWALAVSGSYFKNKIMDSIRAQMGNNLPPPHGPNRILVGENDICTASGLFFCIDWTHQSIYLTAFDVNLIDGAVVFTGSIFVEHNSWYVGNLSGTFSVNVTLDISNDHEIEVTVHEPDANLDQWWARAANWISGGSIENSMSNAIENAFQFSQDGDIFSSLFNSKILENFLSVNSSFEIEINPVASDIEILEDSILLHGNFVVPNLTPRPEVNFSIIPVEDSPTRRLFHAGFSWVPGGEIAEYSWNFGDGHTARLNGLNSTFVVQHDFDPGKYTVCLEILDGNGFSSQLCQDITPGFLKLTHFPETVPPPRSTVQPDEWEFCHTNSVKEVKFGVFNEGFPVFNAFVEIETAKGNFQEYTDYRGNVIFNLDSSDFKSGPTNELLRFVSKFGKFMAKDSDLVWVRVTASKEEFIADSHLLNEILCINPYAVPDPSSYFEDIIKDMIRIQVLMEKYGWDPTVPFEKQSNHVGFDKNILRLLEEIHNSVEIGRQFLNIFQRGVAPEPFAKLMSLDTFTQDLNEQYIYRIKAFTLEIRKSIKKIEEELFSNH